MKKILTIAALSFLCSVWGAPQQTPAKKPDWKLPACAEKKEKSFLIRSTAPETNRRLRGSRSMRTNTQDKSSVLRRKSAQTASDRSAGKRAQAQS